MGSPVVIEGHASAWLRDRIVIFCTSLDDDPWAVEPPGRIVVGLDYPLALRKYMPQADYDAWESRHKARVAQGLGYGVGMGFVARDGVRTAVAAPLPEAGMRDYLLSLICHEICEASMARDDGPPPDVHASMSRVLWSEYVVERRRSTVFHRFGWPRSSLEGGSLCEQLSNHEAGLPAFVRAARLTNVVPDQFHGDWQMLSREFVCATARVTGGDAAESGEVNTFIERQGAARGRVWRKVQSLTDRLFGCPHISAVDLDAQALSEGWEPLWELMK